MNTPVLPRAQAPIADNGLRDKSRIEVVPTGVWLDFFRDLLERVNEDEGLRAEIEALILRLEALEGALIVGPQSIQVFGSLSAGLVTLLLQGDEPFPSPLFYYGTDPLGRKGWQPAASLVSYLVDQDGNYLVDNEGNFLIGADITADLFAIVETSPGLLAHTGGGTWEARTLTAGAGALVTSGDGVSGNPTVAHADTSSVADLNSNNSGTVVIQDVTITFDTFGHVLTATVGTVDVAAALVGTFEPAITAGTTAQFWRGDKTFTNTLKGSLAVDNATTTSPGLLAGIFGVYIAAPDTTASFVHLDAFGSSTGLLFRASGGTAASKTALVNTALIGQFQGRGYDGTAYSGETVGIQFLASEAWGTAAHGTRIRFRTTTNGTTTTVVRWHVEDNGDFVPFADNAYSLGTTALRMLATYTHQLWTHGKILNKGIITPTALAANTDNWTPTGYSDASTIRMSASAPVNLTGLGGGEDGKEIKLMNVGANTITLIHDLTSTAANRFYCPNNTSVAVRQNGWVLVIYDSTSSRWRVMGA